LDEFDLMVSRLLDDISDDLMNDQFCARLRGPEASKKRSQALAIITEQLAIAYEQRVVVLIDEYDAPMHSALEHDYTTAVRSFILLYCSYLKLFQANEFFSIVFDSLLKVRQCQCLRLRLMCSDRTIVRYMQV
jgi:Predicted AAA-ATPase